ncbi:MAG: substrate-binding domain-containing protein [Oscillospiraceae bacterium]|jgi:ABC-type sugar transport system substrate-binding protein|nr:substrate-binding domain-containing protein [Oscillospiraceae bacterium]
MYLRYTNSPLYEDFANSFKVWASKMNCTVDIADTNNDNDLFITSIETLAKQGYDGFLMDPDMDTYPAVKAKCDELGVLWMPVMGLPYDEDKHLTHPFVGFDYREAGEQMGKWLVDYQQKTWPDAKPEEIGVLGVDFSAVYEISVRIDGAMDIIRQTYPDIDDRYFHADCITGNLDSSTAYTESGAILPTQPSIKYWLIVATIDDFADGAVTAAIDAGLEGKVVAISMGSPGLIVQWEAGEQNDWKASLSSIGVIYAEPIFAGLYAQINGDASAEELWVPDWVDKSKGDTYANVHLPSIILTYENYQYYKEWVDLYAGIDISNYPVEATIDMFTTRVNPPASYAG